MDNIFKSKCALSCIIFLMSGTMYLYILNLRPELISKGMFWIVSFGLMLLIYYLIFLISSILQVILIKCFRLFPIKVFTLYPFTYDGVWRVHPIRLIYNIEGFSNSLILNLGTYIEDKELLMNKMKKLLILRKLSFLITYGSFFLILSRFDIKAILVLLIAAMSTILLSYFQYGTFWYGADYLYGKGPDFLREYILASKTIMILSSEQYARALKEEHEDQYLECSILENYLYRSILDKSVQLSVEIIESASTKQINSLEFYHSDLTLDSKRLNLIKLIGLAGYRCQNDTVINLSIEQYTCIYELIANNSLPLFQKYGPATIKKQIDALKYADPDLFHILKIQDMQYIFSSYDPLVVPSAFQ